MLKASMEPVSYGYTADCSPLTSYVEEIVLLTQLNFLGCVQNPLTAQAIVVDRSDGTSAASPSTGPQEGQKKVIYNAY